MRAASLLLAVPLAGCAPVLRPLTATDAAADLEQVTRSNDDELDPAISPDGRRLAYEASTTLDGPRHVEVRSVRTGRLIFSSKDDAGVQPAWMPDGSSIVYVGDTFDGRSKLLQTYGQGVRPVFLANVGDPSFGGTHPAVSPDGNLVAMTLNDVSVRRSEWSSGRHYDHALGVTDLLGTGVKVIGHGLDPAFSPDGARIAFTQMAQGHEHVFVAARDGSSPAQITFGSEDDESPTFSPDGKSIAFCSVHGGTPRKRANLFVARADGSELVQLTEGDRLACHPSWGRDGFIYFHADVGGRFHVFRLRRSAGP